MARVFTTVFSYSGKSYMAVISKIDGSLSIYLPDESLHAILPEGKIVLDAGKGLKIDRPPLTPLQNLVLTILSAVELQHTPAAKMERE